MKHRESCEDGKTTFSIIETMQNTEYVMEGSLEVKLPTIRTDGEAEVGRVREEKVRRKKIREEKGRRKKIQIHKKVDTNETLCFSIVLWLRRVEKVHTIAARRTFRSQNVQNASASSRCSKSARCCGAKHMSKSKCAKHTTFGASVCVAGAVGVGGLKGIYEDAFRVAGAKQETSSSEMLGSQGADFLRGFASWSIRSLGLLR